MTPMNMQNKNRPPDNLKNYSLHFLDPLVVKATDIHEMEQNERLDSLCCRPSKGTFDSLGGSKIIIKNGSKVLS